MDASHLYKEESSIAGLISEMNISGSIGYEREILNQLPSSAICIDIIDDCTTTLIISETRESGIRSDSSDNERIIITGEIREIAGEVFAISCQLRFECDSSCMRTLIADAT